MQLEPPARRAASVSLTPLIDVVFILLVFFMLTTRFTTLQQTPVQIHAAGAPGADEDLVRLRIVDANSVKLNGQQYPVSALDQWLARREPRPLVITSADKVPLQTTIRVTDLVQSAGFRKAKLALLE